MLGVRHDSVPALPAADRAESRRVAVPVRERNMSGLTATISEGLVPIMRKAKVVAEFVSEAIAALMVVQRDTEAEIGTLARVRDTASEATISGQLRDEGNEQVDEVGTDFATGRMHAIEVAIDGPLQAPQVDTGVPTLRVRHLLRPNPRHVR